MEDAFGLAIISLLSLGCLIACCLIGYRINARAEKKRKPSD
jgi:hypothetical protein